MGLVHLLVQVLHGLELANTKLPVNVGAARHNLLGISQEQVVVLSGRHLYQIVLLSRNHDGIKSGKDLLLALNCLEMRDTAA